MIDLILVTGAERASRIVEVNKIGEIRWLMISHDFESKHSNFEVYPVFDG
jgi:hypothetical protein